MTSECAGAGGGPVEAEEARWLRCRQRSVWSIAASWASPARRRAGVMMHYLDGVSVREIASRLGARSSARRELRLINLADAHRRARRRRRTLVGGLVGGVVLATTAAVLVLPGMSGDYATASTGTSQYPEVAQEACDRVKDGTTDQDGKPHPLRVRSSGECRQRDRDSGPAQPRHGLRGRGSERRTRHRHRLPQALLRAGSGRAGDCCPTRHHAAPADVPILLERARAHR